MEVNNGGTNLSELLSPKRSPRLRRMVVLIILFLTAIGVAGLWKFRSSGQATALPGFETEVVRKGNLRVVVSATGTLKPVNQVDVGTEVSGIIREVLVDFNDPVTKGQILAKLDASRLESQMLQAKASLEVAKAEYAKSRTDSAEAETNLQRLEKTYALSHGKVPSKQEIETARARQRVALAQVEVAAATIARAKAALASDQSEMAKASILSPIDGVVLNRSVETGQTVAASLQAPVLFTLAEDLTRMLLYVAVDEADVGQIKEGQAAEFIVDAYPDKTFPARIIQVRFAPQTENGVVTYECLLNVDNSDLLLRPGMTATADILVQNAQEVLLVPNAALRYAPPQTQLRGSKGEGSRSGRPGRTGIVSKLFPRPRFRSRDTARSAAPSGPNDPARVWVLENGTPVAVPVRTGATDGLRTRIVAGELQPGMQVIVGTVRETA